MSRFQNFDTHKAVESFTDAGMDKKQAELVVYTIVQSRDSDLSSLVSKEIFAEARQETKDESTAIRHEMKDGFAKVDKEFVKVRQEAAEFRQEVKDGFAKVDKEFVKVRQEAAEFRQEVKDEFVKVRQEAAEFRQEVKSEFVAVRQEISELRQEMNERIVRLEARFDAMDMRFNHMEEKTNARFDKIEKTMATKEDLSKQEVTIIKWMVGSFIAFSGIIIAAIKLIH